MSEVNGEIEKLEELVRESLLKMFKEKFDGLAPICRDRIASNNDTICIYHKSSPTDCCFSICPRLDLPLDVAASYLEKTEGRRR